MNEIQQLPVCTDDSGIISGDLGSAEYEHVVCDERDDRDNKDNALPRYKKILTVFIIYCC